MHIWKSKKLKELDGIEIILGQSPSSKSYNKKRNGLPFLQGKAEFGMIYPKPKIFTDAPLKIAESNDLLLSVRAPVGDINLSPYKLCIGRGLAAIRFNNDNPKFYFYWFLKNQKAIENLGVGSTFKAITGEQLKKIEIPVVELSEQNQIANILSTVDEAIQKADEAITKTERIKQAMMQKLLSEGIGHKEFKQTKIGKLPKEWGVIRLSDAVKLKNGINFTKQEKGQEGILVVDVLNMFGPSINLDFSNLYRVKKNIPINNDYILVKGDLLFVRSSFKKEGAGWVSLFNGFNENVTYCGFIIRARLITRDLLPEFTTYFLRSTIARRLILGSAGQVAITNISQENISSLILPIPKRDEQIKIVSILKEFDIKIDLLKSRKLKLDTIKHGLMDDLLTGKKRVKIN